MFLFVLILHFLLCAMLVGLVLIQQGKGADMGAAFGSGGSNTLFGAGGATSLIVRITTGTAIAFMITSITLIRLSGSDSGFAAISDKPQSAPAASALEGSVMGGIAKSAEVQSAELPAAETKAPESNSTGTTNPGALAKEASEAIKASEPALVSEPVAAPAAATLGGAIVKSEPVAASPKMKKVEEGK